MSRTFTRRQRSTAADVLAAVGIALLFAIVVAALCGAAFALAVTAQLARLL